MVRGLVDIDRRRAGLLSRTARIAEAELAPERAERRRRWSAAASSVAEQYARPEQRQHPPALLAVLLDRSPQLDRRRDLGRRRARTGWRRCRRRRGTSARCACVCGKPLHQRSPLDDADGDVRAFRLGAEFVDHRRIEQRMVGGRDQQRPLRRRVAAQRRAWSRRSSPLDRSTADRGHRRAGPRRSARAPGVSTTTSPTLALASSARTGRRTIGSPPTGISALRSVPNCSANGSRPAASRRGRSRYSLTLRARRRSGSPARDGLTGLGEPHGVEDQADRSSTRRPARARCPAGRTAGRRPGSPCSGCAAR